MIDRYVDGHRDKIAMKAAYLLRDTAKVVGVGDADKATAGIFYDDLENPRSGGTGHTIKVCEDLNVPVFDQRVWMKWLEEE